jgi:23S rRNA-/tRNA-specific pseudouridylate synthase
LTARGWFAVDRPIKDERGVERNATTYFNFLAGQDNGGLLQLNATKARASLVLARPQTGRWHQVRRHLNGLSHPILGDTTHGSSQTNREWKETRNMPGERTCLHLAHLVLPPNNTTQPFCPNGINVQCGIPNDMIEMMRLELPDIWSQAERLLSEQGISLTPPPTSTFQVLPVFREKKSTTPSIVAQEDETRILTQGEHFVVVEKPPSVLCHFSKWSNKLPTTGNVEPTAMLQRVRDATGQSVNLVHRLDRGASGCLLLAFCDRTNNNRESESVGAAATSALMAALKRPEAIKTYVAIVVGGNGTTNANEDLTKRGWFTVNETVMDSHGRPKQAVTDIRFLAGTTSQDAMTTGAKAALILARPHTGRWHQIRQHLSSSACGYHPIMGDTAHGLARTNREWKEMRGLPKERTCLHLARLQLPPTTPYMPDGLDESCPLPADMLSILQNHLPDVFERAKAALKEEGVQLL